MTQDDVRFRSNWGPPTSVNRLTSAAGVTDYWYYRGTYFTGSLTFENGRLSMIHE